MELGTLRINLNKPDCEYVRQLSVYRVDSFIKETGVKYSFVYAANDPEELEAWHNRIFWNQTITGIRGVACINLPDFNAE